MKQLNSCTFLLNLRMWTLWFSPLWAVNCEPDGNMVLCAWDEAWLLGRSLGSAKQPESWFFWGAICSQRVSFLQSFWLPRGDGGGCIWAARLVPGLMKVSDSEVPAWSYQHGPTTSAAETQSLCKVSLSLSWSLTWPRNRGKRPAMWEM